MYSKYEFGTLYCGLTKLHIPRQRSGSTRLMQLLTVSYQNPKKARLNRSKCERRSGKKLTHAFTRTFWRGQTFSPSCVCIPHAR